MTPEEEQAKRVAGVEAASVVDEYYRKMAEKVRGKAVAVDELASKTRAAPPPKPTQPDTMRDWQWLLLLVVGGIVVLTIIFPPFSVPFSDAHHVFFTRFGFGGKPPGSIDVGLLLAEWFGIGILAAICWVLLSDRDKRRVRKQLDEKSHAGKE